VRISSTKAIPCVVPQDAGSIAAFNRTADPDTLIRLGMMPEPFLGNPAAPVLVLGLNPGFSPDAIRHETHEFFTLSRNNLHHAGGEYPFYLLTPSLDVPGRMWWEQVRQHPRSTVGQQRHLTVRCAALLHLQIRGAFGCRHRFHFREQDLSRADCLRRRVWLRRAAEKAEEINQQYLTKSRTFDSTISWRIIALSIVC